MNEQKVNERKLKGPPERKKINKEPEIVNLDLTTISQNAEASYNFLVEEKSKHLPMSAFAQALRNSNSPHALIAGQILDNAQRLIDMDGIYPPSVIPKLGLSDFEKENIATTTSNLAKLGINIDSDNIMADLEKDERFSEIRKIFFNDPITGGIMGIASGIQTEYTQTVLAARMYEIAKRIFQSNAPSVPWLKESSIFCFDRSWTEDRHFIGAADFNNQRHLLFIGDFFGDITYRIEQIKSHVALAEEYYLDPTLVAIHEAGHGVFNELFGLEKIQEVKKLIQGKSKESLYTSLTEGFAMMYEELGDEILNLMVPHPSIDMPSPNLISHRKYNIKNKNLIQAYPGGRKIIRKLLKQLQIDNLSKKEQINKVADFLRKLDILKIASISNTSKEYSKIINNPLNQLTAFSSMT
jgi:hypothetical protein